MISAYLIHDKLRTMFGLLNRIRGFTHYLGLLNSQNLIRYSINETIQYFINYRYRFLFRLWYLVNGIKICSNHEKNFSMIYVLFGFPKKRDLRFISEIEIENDKKVIFLFLTSINKFYFIRSLKFLGLNNIYDTVKLRYLGELKFKYSIARFRKIRFKIAILNLHFGRFKFPRLVINNIFQNTYLLLIPSGRIIYNSHLIIVGKKHYLNQKKSRTIKHATFLDDSVLMCVRRHLMLIRKVDFQTKFHLNNVTLINEPVSFHFGHFIENDLYSIRFNLFDFFNKGEELNLVCNDQNFNLVDKISQHLRFNFSKVVLTPFTEVSFTNLYVTNKVRLLVHSYRNFTTLYNWRMLESLGDFNRPFLKFNNVAQSDSELKIALLRRSATWRKLDNLSDILDILSKNNFRTIDPENLSIQELYELISRSSHVITEWGSVESNFNLVPLRNKVVIQLCPSNAENQSRAYPGSLSLNNKVHIFYGQPLYPHERHSAWTIDTKSLDNFLSVTLSPDNINKSNGFDS